jgi:hypothetical protein
MKRIAVTFAVLVALFFGVGGIFPALAKLRDTGGIPSTFVGSYTLGVFLLTAVGASSVFYLMGRRKGV